MRAYKWKLSAGRNLRRVLFRGCAAGVPFQVPTVGATNGVASVTRGRIAITRHMDAKIYR